MFRILIIILVIFLYEDILLFVFFALVRQVRNLKRIISSYHIHCTLKQPDLPLFSFSFLLSVVCCMLYFCLHDLSFYFCSSVLFILRYPGIIPGTRRIQLK